MTQPLRTTRADEAGDAPTTPVPSVDSATLMKGVRELVIRHGADFYRLRITASNKLILTK